jgi:hypothetical protein
MNDYHRGFGLQGHTGTRYNGVSEIINDQVRAYSERKKPMQKPTQTEKPQKPTPPPAPLKIRTELHAGCNCQDGCENCGFMGDWCRYHCTI